MVCNRCKMAVADVFKKLGLYPQTITLGEVELKTEPTAQVRRQLEKALNVLGFEILNDRRSRMIEKIKNAIVQWIHHSEDTPEQNLSTLLSQELHYDYKYLSQLFSEVEGITIEKYAIAQKIEKVKELLLYDELSLSEIAYRLGYSSAAYLSNQFKKQTGLTPTFFKAMRSQNRQNLDEV